MKNSCAVVLYAVYDSGLFAYLLLVGFFVLVGICFNFSFVCVCVCVCVLGFCCC